MGAVYPTAIQSVIGRALSKSSATKTSLQWRHIGNFKQMAHSHISLVTLF